MPSKNFPSPPKLVMNWYLALKHMIIYHLRSFNASTYLPKVAGKDRLQNFVNNLQNFAGRNRIAKLCWKFTKFCRKTGNCKILSKNYKKLIAGVSKSVGHFFYILFQQPSHWEGSSKIMFRRWHHFLSHLSEQLFVTFEQKVVGPCFPATFCKFWTESWWTL